MAINAKVGVDIGGFVSGIQQGQSILKGLNAEMKATEAEFKATGNAEDALQKKTKTLNSQLQVQKGIADQAQQALKAMEAAGIKPTDKAYQQMYATMMNATAGMNEAQAALNGLGQSANQAATNADSLNNSVNSIGKKISLEQVINGIDRITSGLENAAKRAIGLGEAIWENVMNAAKWADDTATQAMMFGIDVETYQRMQKLVTNGMDTTVESMLKAQKKLKKGMGEGGLADTLKELGIYASELKDTGGGIMELVPKDSIQLFWEAGRALMNMNNEFDKEAAAQKLFGRSWEELVPLFKEFANQDEYNKALEDVRINSEEDVNALAELNDKVGELKGNFDTLSREMLAQLAPALTDAADALNGLLTKVMDYLKTPQGQEALKNLQEAVSGLFADLGSIDPESVVQNFTNVFNGLVNGLQWIVENKDTLIGALKAIVVGWAGLQLTGGVLQILQLINGLKDLGIIGGKGGSPSVDTGGAPTGGGGGIAVLGKKILTNVAKTAPYLMPFLLGADSLISGWNMQNVAAEKGAESYAKYQAEAEQNAGSRYQEIWDTLMRYTTPTGSPEDHVGLENFAKRWVSWWSDETQDTVLNELTNAMTDEQFLQINDMMNRIASGELFNSEEDRDALLESVESMIGTINELMANEKIETQLDVTTTAADISQKVGTVTIPATLAIDTFLGGIGRLFGFHANGLPFVPYDGYLAMLHRGERVLTASANRNYTFNSNNYFGNVNLNNGQDIDALCTSIDRHNRQVQSGFGA